VVWGRGSALTWPPESSAPSSMPRSARSCCCWWSGCWPEGWGGGWRGGWRRRWWTLFAVR